MLKNKIGKLEKIIITSRDPAPPTMKYLKESGGIFRDMMIHDFDLARYIMQVKMNLFLYLLLEAIFLINTSINLKILSLLRQF